MTLGERVKKRRESMHLSQEELAHGAGITQGLLSRIERGVTSNPGLHAVKGLARSLHCSMDWLAGRHEDEDALLMARAAS